MAVVPPDQVPDEYEIVISAQITTAKDEVLIPIRMWLLVKLKILLGVTFATFMTRIDEQTFMFWYISLFNPVVLPFYAIPEIGLMISTIVYPANKVTRGIQYYIDGCVCILAVS